MDNLFEGLNTSGKIRLLMAAKDMTYQELSILLDVTRATINNRMDANRWDVDDLKLIADRLEVTPQDLV